MAKPKEAVWNNFKQKHQIFNKRKSESVPGVELARSDCCWEYDPNAFWTDVGVCIGLQGMM